jgi:hypothetical protein
VEELEGNRRLGRAGCRWEGSIKMDLERETVDWINLAQDRDK